MNTLEKVEAYYAKDQKFKKEIAILRELALETEFQEAFKWGSPIYTIENKNVLAIMAFKNHFGIWFFNGVFLNDPEKVLENAQEGKTKAMRHWKFTSGDAIDKKEILNYMREAIDNQKKGKILAPLKKAKKQLEIPTILQRLLDKNIENQKAFDTLTEGKRNEYIEYITDAKQEKTKVSRLEKILPMILEGKGLHDKYR